MNSSKIVIVGARYYPYVIVGEFFEYCEFFCKKQRYLILYNLKHYNIQVFHEGVKIEEVDQTPEDQHLLNEYYYREEDIRAKAISCYSKSITSKAKICMEILENNLISFGIHSKKLSYEEIKNELRNMAEHPENYIKLYE